MGSLIRIRIETHERTNFEKRQCYSAQNSSYRGSISTRRSRNNGTRLEQPLKVQIRFDICALCDGSRHPGRPCDRHLVKRAAVFLIAPLSTTRAFSCCCCSSAHPPTPHH